MKREDLEMDDAADITGGCVDPAVNLSLWVTLALYCLR